MCVCVNLFFAYITLVNSTQFTMDQGTLYLSSLITPLSTYRLNECLCVDWTPVVIRKKAPTKTSAGSQEKFVQQAKAAGLHVETVQKCFVRSLQ